MMNKAFFCDTYALIEIIKGNQNYTPYTDYALLTSDFHLIEFYYFLLKNHNPDLTELYFKIWAKRSVHVQHFILKKAAHLRLIHKNDNLSYADCVGYAFAHDNEIPFLTGDSKFEGLSGVEFVK